MTALKFDGPDGKPMQIVNHRHDTFKDIPEDVLASFDRTGRPGVLRPSQHAKDLLKAIADLFEQDEVFSFEAAALTFYLAKGELMEKKTLFSSLAYLVRTGGLVRRTRGYYSLTPSASVSAASTVSGAAKSTKKDHKKAA